MRSDHEGTGDESDLKGREPKSFWGDTLRIQYAENPGAFLGIGGQLSQGWRLLIITGFNSVLLLIVGVLLWKHWQMDWVRFIALALLLAGGIGNLIDRISQNGLVTDFLNIGIGPLRTGIFNVADMAITMGVFMFFIMSWHEDRKKATA